MPARRARRPRVHPLEDPGFARQVSRLLEAQRSTLPSDAELDALAEAGPADSDAASALWDAAQRRAGTGLEGLLSAKVERG